MPLRTTQTSTINGRKQRSATIQRGALMSVIRVGSNGSYAEGWDEVFGKGKTKAAGKKTAKKAAKKKPATKKVAKKKAATKTAKKKTGKKR